MFVNPGVIAAVMATQHTAYRQKQEEEEREKQEKKREKRQCATSLLLVNKKGKSMTIEEKEKIEIYRILNTNNGIDWTTKDKNNDIISQGKTFSLCFEEFLSKIKPKDIEIIPISVDKKYLNVNAYLVMVKVNNEEDIRKEKEIMEVATKIALNMQKDMETTW